jgi:pyridoxine 4-dehydrogenase
VHAWTDPIRLVAPRWTDSPLGLGTLTGKFSSDKLPSGPRKAIAEKLLDDPAFGQLITTMRTVGEAHDGATPAQVALGWCTAKGACVIPGARTLSQASSNVAAADLRLTPDEVARLDAASSAIKPVLMPETNPFPKKDVFTGLTMYDS